MKQQRPTLVQVAQHAGVSLASASRALSNSGASKKTTERVQKSAKELGYVPDATARSLKIGRKLQIAFAVADIGNPVYVEMLRAIEEVVSGEEIRLMVSSTGLDPQETVDIVKDLKRGYADGLIISPLRVTPELIAEISAATVPVIVIGVLPGVEGVDTVGTNSSLGIEMAVAHLKERGRHSIGFINGPIDTTPGRARQRGFDEVEPNNGNQALATDFTVEAGMNAARELLTSQLVDGVETLDAIVTANDLLAIGAVHAAVEMGLRIPQDLAVIGMDDISFASTFNPPLSSISLGSGQRGRLAAQLLLARLADPSRPPQHPTVDPTLVHRQST